MFKSLLLESISSFDGAKIRVASMVKDPSFPYLLVVQGRTENIEKYQLLADRFHFLPEGWNFLTYDHRGQGASDGLQGHIDSYHTFSRDLLCVVQEKIGNNPYRILAHSMGGLITTFTVLRDLIRPESCHLLAPFFGLDIPPVVEPVLVRMPFWGESLGWGEKPFPLLAKDFGTFKTNRLTSDEKYFDRILRVPYPYARPSFSWLSNSIRAINSIFESQWPKNIPLRITSAGQDRVVSNKAIHKWIKYNEDRRVDHLEIEGKHELLFEREDLARKLEPRLFPPTP